MYQSLSDCKQNSVRRQKMSIGLAHNAMHTLTFPRHVLGPALNGRNVNKSGVLSSSIHRSGMKWSASSPQRSLRRCISMKGRSTMVSFPGMNIGLPPDVRSGGRRIEFFAARPDITMGGKRRRVSSMTARTKARGACLNADLRCQHISKEERPTILHLSNLIKRRQALRHDAYHLFT